ncbi:hypothetical protein BpHYR1_022996 [Brachionus plicatilis]|uniref:Uncharacterized protein n=1 Tax=Brachionus plicatilis TaxID=10195 RepID=A0A3M7QVV2_BRAPC|nr:hypothetical protein BpHYR1_022996 [Brachionus plicatilis]
MNVDARPVVCLPRLEDFLFVDLIFLFDRKKEGLSLSNSEKILENKKLLIKTNFKLQASGFKTEAYIEFFKPGRNWQFFLRHTSSLLFATNLKVIFFIILFHILLPYSLLNQAIDFKKEEQTSRIECFTNDLVADIRIIKIEKSFIRNSLNLSSYAFILVAFPLFKEINSMTGE